jgi:DinB superfamily
MNAEMAGNLTRSVGEQRDFQQRLMDPTRPQPAAARVLASNSPRAKMTRLLAVIVGLFLAGAATAQTTDAVFGEALSPSMAAVVNARHATIGRNLAEAAENMPADEYAFRPTPLVRSFGELVGHVASANYFCCSQAKGERAPSTENFERVNRKEQLVKALKDSLEYWDQVYAATTDRTVS